MAESDLGFEILEGVLSSTEIMPLLAALSTADRSRAGARHLMQNPIVRQLANDGRLLAIASRFVGRSPYPFSATLFDKSPEANWLVSWHQDTALPIRRRVMSAEWGPWTIKAGVLYAHAPAAALEKVVALRVHLDDSTSANGPLRILPGTHRSGILDVPSIKRLADSIPAIQCLAPAGGIVIMRPLAVHASSKARAGGLRRVLHIQYAEASSVAPEVELAIA